MIYLLGILLRHVLQLSPYYIFTTKLWSIVTHHRDLHRNSILVEKITHYNYGSFASGTIYAWKIFLTNKGILYIIYLGFIIHGRGQEGASPRLLLPIYFIQMDTPTDYIKDCPRHCIALYSNSPIHCLLKLSKQELHPVAISHLNALSAIKSI